LELAKCSVAFKIYYSLLPSCASCGVVMVTWSVDDWIQMVCWVCSQCSWYCFRYDHWLKIAAQSLILHCSTSGKFSWSSEHPGDYVLIRLRLASLVNLPVYMGLICDYQWFFRNWKRRLQPFSWSRCFQSACSCWGLLTPILQVANLTGHICLSSQEWFNGPMTFL
jgi:hypothetical protein